MNLGKKITILLDKGDEINETVADALRRQIESRLDEQSRCNN
jgi:hypothetical protein